MNPTRPSAFRRALIAAALILPAPLAAQGIGDAAYLTAPQFTQYDIGEGAAKKTIGQMMVPIAIMIPFTAKFTVDLSTAYANTNVKLGDSTTSKISGLTDVQLRGNYTLNDQLTLTLGLNVPTGQYTVDEEGQEAAGQIGNDFLNYPVSSMGNGFGGTGGIAYARPMGVWTLGAGASFRKSTRFTPFDVGGSEFRYTPGDEYRVRVGMDRPVGDGELGFGVSYSAFGSDLADTTSYSTGDRLIGTANWSFPVKGTRVFLSMWDLYRLEGQQLAGDAPPENVFDLNAAVSFEAGKALIQPNIETRLWQVDGERAGQLFNLGTRVRFVTGSLQWFPAVGYSLGKLYSPGASTDVSGFRGSLTIRYN